MLPTYTVHALRAGTITTDRRSLLHDVRPGAATEIPIFCSAIEGGGHRILVDTGLRDPAKWSQTDLHELRDDQKLDALLAELGWSPDDIDIVINTHLHYDHCENNLLFPNAQFFVSRTEWDYAYAPASADEHLYDVSRTDGRLTFLSYRLIDVDDYDILRGLRVIQTPGHSPGHQSVLVHTSEGVLCVAGDASYVQENLAELRPMGNYASAADAVASFQKIRRSADCILMTHDRAIRDFQSAGFPSVPPAETGDLLGRGSVG